MFAKDKTLHLIAGTIFVFGTIVILLVARNVGAGAAVALASLGMAYGVERYQAIRKEGTPSLKDMAASAAPGVVLGLAYEALMRLQ